MKVGLAALHFPFAEHRDEMVSRVHRAAEVIAAAPGCLAVDCWVSEDQQAAVTTGQRESDPALRAGFAAVRTAGVDFDYDERESGPARSTRSPPHQQLPGKPRLRCAEITRIWAPSRQVRRA